jgi:hypothetical protein
VTGQLNVSTVSSLVLSACTFTDIVGRRIVYFSGTTAITITFTNCVFTNITNSSGDGGCIYMYGSSSSMRTCTITSCTFVSCRCPGYLGGALYFCYILPNITLSHFYSCSAHYGGAIHLVVPSPPPSTVNPATARIDSTDFALNTATSDGGSVYLNYAGNISFARNRLCGGTAPIRGHELMINGNYDRGDYSGTCSNANTPACRVFNSNANGCVTIFITCTPENSQCSFVFVCAVSFF